MEGEQDASVVMGNDGKEGEIEVVMGMVKKRQGRGGRSFVSDGKVIQR